jgi:AcrR family transcriptional regulator
MAVTDRQTDRPLRADAQRNLERIVRAARAVLIEAGLDASIDDIAGRAEVGVGTIYRRFGNRDGLIRAVLLDAVELLASSAEGACRSGLPPDEAFSHYVRAAFELRVGALATVLLPVMATALAEDGQFRRRREQMLAAVDALVERAQTEGSLRRDIGTADIMLAVGMASRPAPGVPAEFEDARAGRSATLLLDGLLTPSPSPMPGSVTDRTELDRVLRDSNADPAGGAR